VPEPACSSRYRPLASAAQSPRTALLVTVCTAADASTILLTCTYWYPQERMPPAHAHSVPPATSRPPEVTEPTENPVAEPSFVVETTGSDGVLAGAGDATPTHELTSPATPSTATARPATARPATVRPTTVRNRKGSLT
jgi:hypothetical protein